MQGGKKNFACGGLSSTVKFVPECPFSELATLVVARDRRDVISKCICGAVLVKVLNNIIDYLCASGVVNLRDGVIHQT